jgi:TolB-like protein
MSSDAEQEYFSDGLSEELLNLLARIPNLRVIARTSSFAFKGEKIEIAEIAKKLNVTHVLEGSIRKSGNQVRITAQLVRASDSSHLWSESYDRSLDDVFAIQDEISAAVVEQLKITLLGAAPTVKETDPAAYVLYLQARQMQHLGTPEGWAQSILLYQQALAIAPDYATAWKTGESYSVRLAWVCGRSRRAIPWHAKRLTRRWCLTRTTRLPMRSSALSRCTSTATWQPQHGISSVHRNWTRPIPTSS